MQYSLELIPHTIDNNLVHQRAVDGYINASAMCKAVSKQFSDYSRLKSTQDFLTELSRSTGIPVDLLSHTIVNGLNEERGTWVHPKMAINLAQWCSPKFAVAVSSWVYDWLSGNLKQPAQMPYHLERYVLNQGSIPPTHFSMLNEMTMALIAPMEHKGYTLPENMIPDISEGRMFCRWLREQKGIDTNALPTYTHAYQDGRRVQAKLYPIDLLPDFRRHFNQVWLPQRAVSYFQEKDSNALPYLTQVFVLTHKK